MTDPLVPIKNPRRVPMSLQHGVAGDPIGTAGIAGPRVQIVRQDAAITGEPSVMSIKRNRDTGQFEIAQDGVYVNKETGDSFQFRKGHVLPENAAAVLERSAPWPGEPDEEAVEAQATAKGAPAPENKAAPAPSNK